MDTELRGRIEKVATEFLACDDHANVDLLVENIEQELDRGHVRLPEFESYGKYDGRGYGLHTLKLMLPGITFWYSYDTIVAYKTWDEDDWGLTVCANEFSVTTGKHLNWIDGGDKKNRVSRVEFEKKLAAALKRHGLKE